MPGLYPSLPLVMPYRFRPFRPDYLGHPEYHQQEHQDDEAHLPQVAVEEVEQVPLVVEDEGYEYHPREVQEVYSGDPDQKPQRLLAYARREGAYYGKVDDRRVEAGTFGYDDHLLVSVIGQQPQYSPLDSGAVPQEPQAEGDLAGDQDLEIIGEAG